MLAEALARPLAGIAVADQRADEIALERASELGNHVPGREWRATLTYCVDDNHVLLTMAYRQGHAVGTAARRIDEAPVAHPRHRHPLAHPQRHARLYRFARDKAL